MRGEPRQTPLKPANFSTFQAPCSAPRPVTPSALVDYADFTGRKRSKPSRSRQIGNLSPSINLQLSTINPLRESRSHEIRNLSIDLAINDQLRKGSWLQRSSRSQLSTLHV